MAGVFNTRADFSIPSAIVSEYQWMADSLIDSLGIQCKLIYSPKVDECSNCYVDPSTGRSANIYKAGGSQQFNNYTLCPKCNGEGKLYVPQEESIKLRVYNDATHWKDLVGKNVVIPDGSVLAIGYMTDLPKIERTNEILIYSNLEVIRRWKYKLYGEPMPHGLGARYCKMFLQRVGT